jgi:ComF family protein
MFKIFQKIGRNLLDLLLPIECLNCQVAGTYFCADCLKKIPNNSQATLERLRADLQIPALDQIFIAYDYEDKLLQNLIIKYKYNFISPLSEPLSLFLINFWEKQNISLAYNYLVIPIPLSKKRLKWRGFNQAELLARNFSDHFKYLLSLELKRIKHQKPQAKLNQKKRQQNLKDAFRWTGKNLNNQKILLLDDVVTSGATIQEAARVLKEAGASQIIALVLAKG